MTIAVIRDTAYGVNLELLMADPIVQHMAAEIKTATVAVDTESAEFMNRANAEYARRGGTEATFIGAVAEAIRALVQGAPAAEAGGCDLDVVDYRHDYGTHYVAGVADLADGGAEYTVIIADDLNTSYSHCCHCHTAECEHAAAALRHHERNRHLAVRNCH